MRFGNWMQTFTGKAFWPLDPRPEEIDIEDIAHSLSMQCRYNGHTKRFYSVAEHSYYVSMFATQKNALCGLLHDASEAYITDIPRPLKPYLRDYADIEYRMMCCIAEKYGFTWPMPTEIKLLDNRILINERNQLMSEPPLDWELDYEPLPYLDLSDDIGPYLVKDWFLGRFYELTTGKI